MLHAKKPGETSSATSSCSTIRPDGATVLLETQHAEGVGIDVVTRVLCAVRCKSSDLQRQRIPPQPAADTQLELLSVDLSDVHDARRGQGSPGGSDGTLRRSLETGRSGAARRAAIRRRFAGTMAGASPSAVRTQRHLGDGVQRALGRAPNVETILCTIGAGTTMTTRPWVGTIRRAARGLRGP